MLKNPQDKYRPFVPVGLVRRTWPDRVLTAAPLWLSTDLRDGNQALFEPMDSARKQAMFALLCTIGFREIEVGFPSASQTEFDFVRHLIDDAQVPDGVTIGVLTPARADLIARSIASLHGAKRAVVHLYNATSPLFRKTVFGRDKEAVKTLAVEATQLIRTLTQASAGTEWVLEYSPETFSATELAFAVEICDAVVAAWAPTGDEKVIINLPATVEMSTPNVFADQIEWMHRQLAAREQILLSVHPHNDRGTAVAAAELAVMAGAERVEGCLFGNGERTGNVDLVTLALNLYTQGIDPGLDFSAIDSVVRVAEECTRLPVGPRHPYAGDLVFTAFSGSHQDAIRKGLAAARGESFWNVPYLPLDPADVGRGYDAIVRINSQSGKGGVAYLLERDHGLVLPRRLQIEFSQIVKEATDESGGEMSSSGLWTLFTQIYLTDHHLRYRNHELYDVDHCQGVRLVIEKDGQPFTLEGVGQGPLDAAVRATGAAVCLCSYEEYSLGTTAQAEAVAFIELAPADGGRPLFGVGISSNIVTASYIAVFRAFDRLAQRGAGRWVCATDTGAWLLETAVESVG
ncbi:MAG: 2-isopropylmalate synthase [Acidiferrobacter sp.]